MRKKLCVVALLSVIILGSGCRREEKIKLEPTDETTPTLGSAAFAADPKSSVQLLKGFHGIEQNSWRWTMGRFSVVLQPPKGAPEKGATLTLKFTIPDAVIQQLKATTVSVLAQNTPIGKQSYTAPGEYALTVDVPASLFKEETVTVEYIVEPFIPAGKIDARELGLVFVSAELNAK